MKKLLCTCIACAAFSVSVTAQQPPLTAPEKALVDLYKTDLTFQPSTPTADPTLQAVAGGYEISVPSVVINATTPPTVLPAYTQMLTKIADVNGSPAFETVLHKTTEANLLAKALFTQMDKASQTPPEAKKSALIGLLDLTAVLIPDLNVTYFKNIKLENVSFKIGENQIFSLKDGISQTTLTPLPEQKFNYTTASSVQDIVFDMFVFSIKVGEIKGLMQASDVSALDLTSGREKNTSISVVLSNVKFYSMFAPISELMSNLSLYLESKVVNAQNIDVLASAKMDISGIKLREENPTLLAKLPQKINMAIKMTGFEENHLNQLFAIREKLELLQEDAAQPHGNKDPLQQQQEMDALQKSIDKVSEDLQEKIKIDVQDFSVSSDKYAVVIKGVLDMQTETFTGTVAVTGMDFLAKELFFLQPYRASAERSVDAKGQTVETFAIRLQGDDLFINGQAVPKDDVAPAAAPAPAPATTSTPALLAPAPAPAPATMSHPVISEETQAYQQQLIEQMPMPTLAPTTEDARVN